MKKIVECVPNFSEGRRPEIMGRIVGAIQTVKGVTLLDQEMNADHNRAVVTFIGEPEPCVEAAFRGIKKAMELIDLTKHTGEHPRIGATDVCPFIPISNITNEECIELANRLAKRVAEELKIPTYLYELAATRPERTDLAVIRKGEFEGLRETIKTDPSRSPDYGPNDLHPTAGATVIGVRFPLIAYNVNLNTQDLEIAKKIAKAIRSRDGGFRYAKALGFEIKEKNCVQVSINMTNYTGTSLYRVLEAVKREAERYGVTVRETEIVGLTPQQALIDSAVWYLQLDTFKNEQILENRLESAPVAEEATPARPLDAESSTGHREGRGLAEFVAEVAAPTPTPGGGSVAAMSGALGVSLLTMAAGLTIGKKGYEAVQAEITQAQAAGEPMREQFLAFVDQDAQAFERVMAAFRLPKATDSEKEARSKAIQEATKGACEVPLKVMTLAVEALKTAVVVAEKGNRSSITDAGVGLFCLQTALKGAFLNVLINLPVIKDEDYVTNRKAQAMRLIQEGRELSARIEVLVQKGMA
jgi:glutamate formiminotransferase/formiminotetrahydrofolate cyclodeaminase